MLTTLTLNERERLAYAEGYTETAALLAEMADLERERDELIEENDKTIDERDDALKSVDQLGCKLHDTRAELELARDNNKSLRSALMALEAEVSPEIKQFIREVLQ
jgi:predicted nuclease with TOPRIM domain